VSPGHCLIISKAIKETFFDLSAEEKEELSASSMRLRPSSRRTILLMDTTLG